MPESFWTSSWTLPNWLYSGAVSLHDAFTQAEAIRTSAERDKILKREKAKREKAEAAADAERNATIIADLTQAGAANYVDLIDSGTMTPKAAWAAYREDTRKEREHAEQDRQARSDLYSGIAQALSTLGVYGGYEDVGALMANYNPGELNPPMLDRYLELNNLESALRLVTELIEWRKNARRRRAGCAAMSRPPLSPAWEDAIAGWVAVDDDEVRAAAACAW